ncbi:MAG: NADH-quinone oxidoreductase subunit N [Burkholderiales bacterium]|jgi:NADH-quinone oxidoreductase subunit N|nr:NADH-quinone oxidoreductase subunit N [Burkholderiales bacterium]
MNWYAVLLGMLPENLLLLGIVAVVVLEIAGGRGRAALPLAAIAVGAAACGAFWLALNGATGAPFPGQFSVTPGSLLAKGIVLSLVLPVLILSRDDFADGPFYLLVLSSLYGVCLLMSADSFLTLFLGLEIMSLPVYALVLLAFRRPQSAEAALKYLVLSGAASATFLLGASFLYGASGSLELDAFTAALGSSDAVAVVAVALVIIAFFLKAAVVPFHTWAPDAYEAASIPVTAYMATVIKAGVLLAVLRLVDTAPLSARTIDLLAVLPLVSIVWGNLAAIRQQSFRRMIAYSSIAHAGYLFFAFLGDGPGRFEAVVFYVLAYGLMNLLAFASIPAGDDSTRDRLENLKGLYQRQPYAALMLGVAMLSLAGIPPFPGFVAKFLVFTNVMQAGHTFYAVLGLAGSYLGIYFYLRVIQYAFMSADTPVSGRGEVTRAALGASVLCLVPTVVISIFPGWVIGLL